MLPLCCSWHVQSRILPRVACANTRVPVSDELGMIRDVLLSDTCKQMQTRSRCSDSSISHRCWDKDEPWVDRLLSTSNSSETALEKELFRPYGAILIGLTEAHRAKMSFSVCWRVGWSLTFRPVLWCKPLLSLACWPALANHPIISPCFICLSFLCKIKFVFF